MTMKRSLKDAIVGFSLLGGLIVFSGSILWLRDFRISSGTWKLSANFDNARGLAVGSPVTFKGIHVGTIEKISFTPEYIQAKMNITNRDLLLFKPTYAKVVSRSLLGGDIEVSLVSKGKSIKDFSALPTDQNCPNETIVCQDEIIKGYKVESISSLTEELNQILSQAEEQEIIHRMVNSIEQFDRTQENLDELIELSKEEIIRAKPIIIEMQKTMLHINNILETIDNPETLENITITADSIRSITQKIDTLSTDLSDLINNEEFTNAIKNAAIGIGKLFNDIYP